MPSWMVYTIGLELILDLALLAVWLLGGVTLVRPRSDR